MMTLIMIIMTELLRIILSVRSAVACISGLFEVSRDGRKSSDRWVMSAGDPASAVVLCSDCAILRHLNILEFQAVANENNISLLANQIMLSKGVKCLTHIWHYIYMIIT